MKEYLKLSANKQTELVLRTRIFKYTNKPIIQYTNEIAFVYLDICLLGYWIFSRGARVTSCLLKNEPVSCHDPASLTLKIC